MTETELIALAIRCEQATGPDRELDGEIAMALMPHRDWFRFEDTWGARCISDDSAFDMPDEYTRSIDAAMTLAPDGFELAIYTNWPLCKQYEPQNDDGSWTITDRTPRGCWVRAYGASEDGPTKNVGGLGHSAPLAISAIGLRIHAALAAGTRRAETSATSARAEGCQSGGEAVTPNPEGLKAIASIGGSRA